MAGSTSTPYGFRLVGSTHGGDVLMKTYYVDGGLSTAIFAGDVIDLDSDGERVFAAAAGTDVSAIGVCTGTYDSDRVANKYLASLTAGYVDVCIDPYAIYEAQVDDYRTSSTALEETYCNNNVDHIANSGEVLTGMSGHTLDATGPSTGTAQFRIIGAVDRVGNVWGDRYVDLKCMFNEHALKQTTGV